MNWFTVRVIFLLFLASIALVRKAQNDFYENDLQNPLRGLFPFEGGSVANLKDTFDDGNIQKVIGILQNNIKQWSFIESQLLEPNVNLGMPEIFIPLKHLTTTLEILGNIFFVRNELSEARHSLERACPLMELLPASLLSDADFSNAANEVLGADGMRLDPAEFSSFFWMTNSAGSNGGGNSASGSAGQPSPAINAGNADGSGATNYAAGCFALLRDVYARLYGTTGEHTHTDTNTGFGTVRTTNDNFNPQPTETQWHSSHNSVPSSYILPNGKPRELNLKYVLSGRQQRQQMKTRKLARAEDNSVSLGSRLLSSARSTKVSNAKLSMAGATVGDVFREKSAAAQLSSGSGANADATADSASDEVQQAEQGHRRRNHKLLLDSDSLLYGRNTGADADGSGPASKTAGNSKNKASTAGSKKHPSSNNRRTSVFSDPAEEDTAAEVPTAADGLHELEPDHPSLLVAVALTEHTELPGTSSSSHAHSGFNVEQQLADLRSPFEHLRAELLLVQDQHASQKQGGRQNNHNNNNNNNKTNRKKSPQSASSPPSTSAFAQDSAEQVAQDLHTQDATGDVVAQAGTGRGAGLGLRSTGAGTGTAVGQQPGTGTGEHQESKNFVRGFEGSALNTIEGQEITSPGVATSLIAEDLEVLLRKFVRTDRKGKRGLLAQARRYYDELDINFPNMDYNEYAANMDVGQAYLEVMGRVNSEGFAFIASELRVWRDIAEQQRADAAKSKPASSSKSKSTKHAKSPISTNNKDAGQNPAAALAPVQLTMAERNRLLVLYAFDILRANPQDNFDLALGFNRGIVDNDRSRRGEHFMSDTLYHNAMYSHIMSSSSTRGGSASSAHTAPGGMDGAGAGTPAFQGLSAVDDAHKRLFPFDHTSLTGTQLVSEEQLLEMVQQAGAEYLAAKSAKQRGGGGSGESNNGNNKEKARNRRRRQRTDADLSDPLADHTNSVDGTAGIQSEGYYSSSSYVQDKDGAADLYDENLASTLRSSVPSLTSGADWTLSIFVLFMVLTGAVVYSAYQEAARKRSTAGRRLRQPGTGATTSAAAGKKSSIFTGTGFVDFLYAMMGNTNSPGEWDADRETSAATADAAADTGAVAGSAVWSSLFAFTVPSQLSTREVSTSRQGGVGAATSTTSGAQKKRGSKDGTISGASSDTANSSATPVHRKTTLLSDFLAMLSAPSPATTADARAAELVLAELTAAPASALLSGATSNHSSSKSVAAHGSGSDKSHPATDVGAAAGAAANAVGNGKTVSHKDPGVAAGGTQSTYSKGKNKKVANSAQTAKAAAPIPASTPGAAATPALSKKAAASDSHTSLTSITSTSSDDLAELFVPPVALNNRRVSYAGLINPALLTSDPQGEDDWHGAGQGDWAEARKKGSKKHTSGEDKDSATAGAAPRTDRISLALKDSPLYRHPTRAPTQMPPRSGPLPTASNGNHAQPPQPQHNVGGDGVWGNGKRPVPLGPAVQNKLQIQHVAAGGGAGTATQPQHQVTSISTANSAAGVGNSKARMYDLSEAKMLAQQLGGWSVSPSSTGPTGSGSASASAPPGLPRSALPSPSATAVNAVGNNSSMLGLKSPTSSAQQFGFSHFDILTSSANTAGNAPVSAWNPSTAAAGGNPSLSSLAASLSGASLLGNTSASIAGGASAGRSAYSTTSDAGAGLYEAPSYLGDLVNYLDSARNTKAAATSAANTTATSTAGTTYYNGALYADNYYGAQEDVLEAYDMVDDPYYDAYNADYQYGGAGLYQHQQQEYDYNGQFGYDAADGQVDSSADTHTNRDRVGNARSSTGGSGGYDLAPSITLEASAVYGLSPDAPSFRPSTLRSTGTSSAAVNYGGASVGIGGAGAGAGAGLGLAPISGSRLFGGQYGASTVGTVSSVGVGTTGISGAHAGLDDLATGAAASSLFNPDEFYESILIDSILGGDEAGAF